MARVRYVRVRAPWDATVDVSSPYPARFYLSLIGQTLEYSSPASRRGGRAWALVGRRGIPETVLAGLLRRGGAVLGPRAALPELDVVAQAWPQLRAQDPSLPVAPRLSGLALSRASARTVFLFADGATPLLVAKAPRSGSPGVEREVAALQEAAASGLAPRYLGVVDGAGHVQRGLAGRAMTVAPIRPDDAASLPWTDQHRAVATGLEALARATRKAGLPAALADDVIEHGLTHPGVTDPTRQAVRAAVERLRADPVSVLAHTDTSPQNILFDGGRLAGLVDWADSTSAGLPGSDLWNAALAYMDKGVGLVDWDEQDLLRVFERSWFGAPFGRGARAAARACAAAAGADDALHDARELAFFARRVGHRVRRPQAFPTSADFAARALELVRADLSGG